MSTSWRVLLAFVLLVSMASAAPVELTVSPALPARNLFRWQLLPDLVAQKPGDAVEVYRQANAAIKEVEPDRQAYGELTTVMEKLRTLPLSQVDSKRLREIVTRFQKPLDRIAQAARREQANWDFVTERLRKSGIAALLDEVQQVREFLTLLHLQARLYLLEGHPEKAVEVVATTFSLARQISECPTLVSHLVALATGGIALDMLQDCLQHPKCPGLYGPLTDLPRPFLPVRRAYEGERVMCYGTVPGLLRIKADPLTALDPTTLDQLVRLYRGLIFDRPTVPELRPIVRVIDRVTLATAMQKKYPLARKALLDAGYPEATVAKMPILNASLLHAALEYDEWLGQMAAAALLPYPQARARFDEIKRKMPRSSRPAGADEPAFPLARNLLPASGRVLLADLRVQRRIELLRVAEALRQHAAQTGRWPATLVDVKAVSLPMDPATLKPFEYRFDGDVAVLHAPLLRKEDRQVELTLRLTLCKNEEKKP